MRVVIYANSDNKMESKRLLKIVGSVVPFKFIEVCGTIEMLSEKIRQLPRNIYLAVLSVQNDVQLSALISSGQYLEPIRIILILPEGNHEMATKAHLLHPRYIAYADGDYSDVAAVLSKMMRNGNSHEGRYVQELFQKEETYALESKPAGSPCRRGRYQRNYSHKRQGGF